MITTTTSKEINLTQLDKELGAMGLCMNEENEQEKVIGIAEGSSLTLAELKTGIANHKAVYLQATLAEKLAIIGLDIDELKAALA